MSSVVEEVALVARTELAFRRVSFELQLARKPLAVFVDRVQMQQVVLNLILNAVDAAARRPSNRPLVILRTRSRHARAVVEVEDNGAGIEQTDLRRLFEPFFTTKKDGMGLGLTIATDIVRAHGGVLTAAARNKGGAIFRISLPVARSVGTQRSSSRDLNTVWPQRNHDSELHLVIAERIATSRRLGAEVLITELATAVTLLDSATKSKSPVVLRRAIAIGVGMLDFAARISPRIDLSPSRQQRIDKLRMHLQARLRELNAPGKPTR
jgi:anti-sigma regulatory factor (Ser/Thr protein kinase)